MNITVDFVDIKVHLDNLEGDGNLGESINNILNLLGGFIWDQLKDLLLPLLDDLLIGILNDALGSCSIADLIANGSCFQDRLAERMTIDNNATFPLFCKTKDSVH